MAEKYLDGEWVVTGPEKELMDLLSADVLELKRIVKLKPDANSDEIVEFVFQDVHTKKFTRFPLVYNKFF